MKNKRDENVNLKVVDDLKLNSFCNVQLESNAPDPNTFNPIGAEGAVGSSYYDKVIFPVRANGSTGFNFFQINNKS